jgi:DNA-directed RNA polymerase specialized sigma24 family protein
LNSVPKTNKQLISHAGHEESCQQGSAIGELVDLYRPFVIAVMASRKASGNAVDDLSQDFIRDKMMSGNIFRAWAANPKSRFRNYLRRSIHNFCNDVLKTEKKSPPILALDFANEPSETPSLQIDEDTVWIRTIFAQAVSQMKSECDEKGQVEIWRLFFDQVLAPLFLNAENRDAQLISNDQRTKNLLVSAGRKFRRFFKAQLLAAGGFEQDLEATELKLLLRRTCADVELVSFLSGKEFFDDEISRVFLSGSATPSEVHLAAVKVVDSEDQKRWLCLLNQNAKAEVFDLEVDLTTILDLSIPTQTKIADLLFGGGEASLELVHKLRKRARDLATDEDSADKGVFYVLYTHLICLLLVKWEQRVTRLNSVQLLHNIQQCLTLDWLDGESQALLEKAKEILSQKD